MSARLAWMVAFAALGCSAVRDTDGGKSAGFVLPDAGLDSRFHEGCGELDVVATKQTPTVVFLIDRSASMIELLGARSRWEVVRSVLADPTEGIVKQFQSRVRFGATLFHGEAVFTTCPNLEPSPIALNNFAAIDRLLADASPSGDTPTGAALRATAESLKKLAEPGPRFIVLLTDGLPDTCLEPNPQNGQEEAVWSAGLAFTGGVGIFVVSLGDELTDEHLQQLANAGAGVDDPTKNASFDRAPDATALKDAFARITDDASLCSFTLGSKVLFAERGKVTLNGERVEFQDPKRGFRVVGDDTLQLIGTACDELKMGESDLHVSFPCEDLLH